MQAICKYTGIPFKVDYMPLSLSAGEIAHPIFSASNKQLKYLAKEYFEGNLNSSESYLLYVALFHSSKRIDFRTHTTYTSETEALIANNMESLCSILEIIHEYGDSNKFPLPHFVVSSDTFDLQSSGDWIDTWNQNYKDFQDSYKSTNLLAKISQSEESLERFIKDKTKDISSYASNLARWASMAGNFPQEDAGEDMQKIMGKRMSLSDYWQSIIRDCARGDNIFKYPIEDVEEVIRECEEFIPQGSIFAFTLMNLLREGRDKLGSFFNLGDINLGRNGDVGFRILDASASVEDANKLALIAAAPATEPKAQDYPSKFAYIRAKMNWMLKMENEAANKFASEMKSNATLLDKL